MISTPSLLAVKSAIILYSDTRGVSLTKESVSGAEMQWVNNVMHLFPGATFHVLPPVLYVLHYITLQ